LAHESDLVKQERKRWADEENQAARDGRPIKEWLVEKDHERRFESAQKKLVGILAADAYAKARKISIDDLLKGKGPTDTPTVAEHIVNVMAYQTRDRLIESMVCDLAPVWDAKERSVASSVFVLYLDDRLTLENLTEEQFKQWFLDQLKIRAAEKKDDLSLLLIEIASFAADVHDRVRSTQ